MKKKYLLLNFVIVTATTNSFTMITKFSPIKNTSKQSYRLKSTQNNFQNKHSNDFQAIGLYNKLQSLQLNIVHEDTKDLRKTPWDYSCGTTPWDFYKVNFDKSGIDSWSSTVIGSSYKHIDTITDDIDNALNENLPSWLDLEKIKEFNDSIKQRIKENFTYIENHNNFLIQYHNALTISQKKYSYAKQLEGLALKRILDIETRQFQDQLRHNNKLIFQNLNAINHHFWTGFFDETEKRNKANIE